MATLIHPLCTGTATLKEAVRRGRGSGLRRRTGILRDERWSSPLPIYCWLIEHDEGLILVDAGEVAGARDMPFVRFEVAREDEVDAQLGRIGFGVGDLRSIVLTHAHLDHIDGLARLPPGRTSMGEVELRSLRSPPAGLVRRLLGTPLPAGFDPQPLLFAGEAFGAFAQSQPLTSDGTVVAVPTPGHTPGHISVIVDIDGRHHFLAGDATYDQGQLLALRLDGLSPSGDQARATMRRILRHATQHPTVYLPSHDIAARDRLIHGVELRSD